MVDRRDFLKYSALAVPVLTGYGKAFAQVSKLKEYPISSVVYTTLQHTVEPGESPATTILLAEISKYKQYGYGSWKLGPGLDSELRLDIMPAAYSTTSRTRNAKLLSFFAITDIHITDKESPSQAIFLQQLVYPSKGLAPWSFVTSIYSPVMLYTTHVLDAAVQTINALHRQNPIDFGLSLGDACNSTQYNELRWYIDVLDGQIIRPGSGAHVGADSIDFQKPYKAVGLDKSIPWYQAMGNHDHFWIGSLAVNDELRKSYISDTVIAAGDILLDPKNISKPDYYMGVLDGSTPNGDVKSAGPVENFSSPPQVVADPDRRSLTRTEWMKEFSRTSSNPPGHGFNEVDAESGFACYSFVPKSAVPIKVIVLDDTQSEDDGSVDFHWRGYLDQARYDWLKNELADGQAAGQLMIIAAHIPIGVEKPGAPLGWVNDAGNAVAEADLIRELHRYPNFILWLAGHRHFNTIKPFLGTTPEAGFWQVETSSLRDFPQQFRMFDIYFNSDNSLSIVTTNVDPSVQNETPAAKSRMYAIATQQIIKTNVYAKNTTEDPDIRPMPTGSYNAELVVPLSPEMQTKINMLLAGHPEAKM